MRHQAIIRERAGADDTEGRIIASETLQDAELAVEWANEALRRLAGREIWAELYSVVRHPDESHDEYEWLAQWTLGDEPALRGAV